ncbi:hypothetical protein [Dongia sp.]|uniref:hypothetical protein n=1 Tax=Dongia sp. TaxID=1977262 RepID=UPI003753779F
MALMGYSEAFSRLGYKLEAPRTDWSAANEQGVCISIWRSEMKFISGLPELNTKRDAGPLELWSSKPGNSKRKQHLSLAKNRFDSRLDVVIVEGTPGEGVQDAAPWLPKERKGATWTLVYFEPDTGHFHVRAKPST